MPPVGPSPAGAKEAAADPADSLPLYTGSCPCALPDDNASLNADPWREAASWPGGEEGHGCGETKSESAAASSVARPFIRTVRSDSSSPGSKARPCSTAVLPSRATRRQTMSIRTWSANPSIAVTFWLTQARTSWADRCDISRRDCLVGVLAARAGRGRPPPRQAVSPVGGGGGGVCGPAAILGGREKSSPWCLDL
eukprot:scaffold3392_cov131-Isochrysis_galbana.AAC.7